MSCFGKRKSEQIPRESPGDGVSERDMNETVEPRSMLEIENSTMRHTHVVGDYHQATAAKITEHMSVVEMDIRSWRS